MKVLFDHECPFSLAHGGFQIQIEQTLSAVRANGVEVEPVRWWDETQKGDIIHYFGRPPMGYFLYAKKKGIKFVFAPLLTGVGSRPRWILPFQRFAFIIARRTLPWMLQSRFAWDVFVGADVCLALTPWEGRLMSHIFGALPERVEIVPNGIEEVFLAQKPAQRGPWLICTATITERKRVLELAQAAVEAETPVWIVGRPYADSDPYARAFLKVAKENPKFVRFEGPINNRVAMAEAYREARGFVLLSDRESLSLSALEAAGCECPLLLSDLPWARETFRDNARYCPMASTFKTAAALREFYDLAPSLKAPPKPMRWMEIGAQLKTIYARLSETSR